MPIQLAGSGRDFRKFLNEYPENSVHIYRDLLLNLCSIQKMYEAIQKGRSVSQFIPNSVIATPRHLLLLLG